MTLQADFRNVTNRIIGARQALAQAEVERVKAKRTADLTADELDILVAPA